MSKNNSQLVLDIRGQLCPSCLLLTLKEVTNNASKLEAKDFTILVISDDRHATATIPDAVHNMGFTTTIEKTIQGYQILIFKE